MPICRRVIEKLTVCLYSGVVYHCEDGKRGFYRLIQRGFLAILLSQKTKYKTACTVLSHKNEDLQIY